MIFIGIDPGLDGAIALIDHDYQRVEVYDVPTLLLLGKVSKKTGKPKKKRAYDTAEMGRMLGVISTGLKANDTPLCSLEYIRERRTEIIVGIEKQHAMPKQGLASTFSTGVGYGFWLGLLVAFEIPHVVVTSQAWKKDLMAGMVKEKHASLIAAKRLFPQAAEYLARKKDHGRADAILIAEHTRRKNG